ncbi:MAG: glutamate--tRNA ligase family protein [Bacteroidota bacterium]
MDLEESHFKTRISPTPSGYLHLGNALNFVYTWLMARSHNATLILRIDDLDAARMRPEYVEDIFRTLDWLGLDYDEGPQSPDELQRTYSQNLRIDRYLSVIKELEKNSFVCTSTRKEIEEESEDGQYPGTCRYLNLDPELLDEYAIRILTPEGSFIEWDDLKQGPQRLNLYASMRDFIIQRKDGLPAYQIASLVDDVDMGVNILVRGEDLKDSSAAQLFLAKLLGYDTFLQANFLHHPLLRGLSGEKLSKSAGDLSIRELRRNSTKSSDIISQIAQMLGCPNDLRINDVHELLLHVNHIDGLLELSK